MKKVDMDTFLSSLHHKPLSQLQREVDEYIAQFKEGYFSPLAMLTRLAEEVGELAREVNHDYGEKPKKTTEVEGSIAMELGDILFVLLCFSNSLRIDLTEAHNRCLHKFYTRDAERWIRINNPSQHSE